MEKMTEGEIRQLLSEVKGNYSKLVGEWSDLQADLKLQSGSKTHYPGNKHGSGHVRVSKDDLSQLATEITQLRQAIPTILNKKVLCAYHELVRLEEENKQLQERYSNLSDEVVSWKSKYTVAIQDTQAEKQECMKLRCEIQSLSEQLSQQSDYSFSLGSACCTLLWRVSKHEDSIQSILAGTKVDEFLQLVSSTLHSFLSAYKDEWPQDGSQETTFILALCGIVTSGNWKEGIPPWEPFDNPLENNEDFIGVDRLLPFCDSLKLSRPPYTYVAACAYGRDFLMNHSHGNKVFDTYIHVLAEAPSHKSARLKNLILMCLYNLSINRKGLKYLSTKSFLPGLVIWLLQGENDKELQANCLRVLQSLVCDEDNFNIVHQVSEQLPSSTLEQLSQDVCAEIRDLALELISDLQQLAAK